MVKLALPETLWLLRPTDACALLGGFSAGLLTCGYLKTFRAMYDGSPGTGSMTLCIALAFLASGMYAPHRFALWFTDRLWRRFWAEEPGGMGCRGVPERGEDRPLRALVLAAMALLSGAASLAGLGLVRAAGSVHAALLDRFLLDRVSLVLAELLLVASAAGPVFIVVGATWSCVHYLSFRPGGWGVRPLAGGLTGVGLAVAANGVLTHELPASATILSASIAFFGLSILALRRVPSAAGPSNPCGPERRRPVPRVSDRRSGLLGAAVVLSCSVAVASVTVWARLLAVMGGGPAAWAVAVAAWCFATALGVALARVRRARVPSWGDSPGLPFAWPGVATAIGIAAISLLGERANSAAGAVVGLTVLAAGLVGIPAYLTGHALAEGMRAYVARSGDASDAGTALVSWSLLASALTVLVTCSAVVPRLGTLATLAFTSVASGLIALGLSVGSAESWRRSRAALLAGVVGTVGLPTVTLSIAESSWLASRPWKRLSLEEGGWLTRSVWAVRGEIVRITEPPVEDALAEAVSQMTSSNEPLIEWHRLPPCARVAILGEVPATLLDGARAAGRHWDHARIDPTAPRPDPRWSGPTASVGAGVSEAAHRLLRRTHRRYDLAVIAASDLPADVRHGPACTDLIERALARATPDGVVVLLAPAGECSRVALLQDLRRLERVAHVEFAWQMSSLASESMLVLSFGRGEAWRKRWESWSGAHVRTPDELLTLLTPRDLPGRGFPPEDSREFVSARGNP